MIVLRKALIYCAKMLRLSLILTLDLTISSSVRTFRHTYYSKYVTLERRVRPGCAQRILI